MQPRERVLTALRRELPDRVPYDITPYGNGLDGFNREAARLFKERTGSDSPDKYFAVEKDIEWVMFKNTKLDPRERFLKIHDLPEENYRETLPDFPQKGTFTLDEWGTALMVGSIPAYDHFIAPLVKAKSIEEMENYPLPDFTSGYRHAHLKEEVKRVKEKGLASVGAMNMTIFEVAWHIRGLNELLTDFVSNEELTGCLLDRITELRIFQAKRFAESGLDIIHIGDDVGMEDRLLMSPNLWRKWLKPRLAKIIKDAKEINPSVIFFYHSDGYVEPIIPDFIEIGIDVLNPVQPECMEPAELKREFGDKLAFWGTMGIQHTLPFGTPEEVEEEVKERIDTVGKGGGLYLSPTHVIAPEVPYRNIFAFVEAVKKYGRYE